MERTGWGERIGDKGERREKGCGTGEMGREESEGEERG